MGKGERGKAEESRREYGAPAAQSSTNRSTGSGNIMYGQPTANPVAAQPRATPQGYTQTPPSDVAMQRTGQGSYAPSQGGNQDYQGIMRDILGDRPLNTATMLEIEPQLAQHGMRFTWNADHTRPDIVLPSGQQIDFVNKMGDPNAEQKFQWSDVPITRAMREAGDTRGLAPGGGMTGPGGVAGGTLGDYGNIQSQFQRFADTGGYTPEQLGNIRARAVSPIRSIYSGARRDIDRQRSLQGGYSPNRTAALGKMAREQSYATSDAATNTEAALAQMVNQGQRYGTSGMAGMYGATPGLASTFGNQAIQNQQLQNQMARGMTQDQISASQLPGAWETSIGRASQIGGAVMPFLSDKNAKHDIEKAPKILPRLRRLPIHTWKYNDDETVHIGPMAQDFSELFGGDSKTIQPVDVAGVALGAIKEIAAEGRT